MEDCNSYDDDTTGTGADDSLFLAELDNTCTQLGRMIEEGYDLLDGL